MCHPSTSLSFAIITVVFIIITPQSNCQSTGDVRLVGASVPNAGRVEIYHNWTWGTVCDDYWDRREGEVVCRQLGYSRTIRVFSSAYFGSGNGTIWMDNVQCTGREARLADCSHNGWGVNDCSHGEDAGVTCNNFTDHTAGGGNCTFETGPNLCGYTDATDDHFNWTLNRGRTPSYNTGPRNDHTTGYGHYIYIETSSPRRPDEKARIKSPVITGDKCIEFYYHMQGSAIGELNVYLKTVGRYRTLIWQQLGDQATGWIKAQVPVNGYRTFQIVFEGVVGSSYTGDIALDDIKVLDSCKNYSTGNCSFESGNFCGYTNEKDDDFNWNRHHGQAPNSWATGPRRDHTTGNGYYVFIKTNSPHVAGQVGQLISPEIHGAQCVQFFYFMRGATIGELNVFVDNGVSKKIVWKLQGERSSNWTMGMVPLNGSAVKIIFEGVSGSDYRDCIALDDITMLQTTCKTFPPDASTTPIDIRNVSKTVRLVGGSGKVSSGGRVEVFHQGRWGTVCGLDFPLTSARVVCRQLGFLDVELVIRCCSLFPAGRGRILLDDVRCRGEEPAISMCSHKGWGVSRCSHSQDVGVICKTSRTLRDVRLNGSSNAFEGRVEVKIAGIWGTVSDMGWDIFATNVFCIEVGFKGATAVYNGARYGRGSGPVWIKGAVCKGDESTLWNCNVTINTNPSLSHWYWNNPHKRDAGAECFDLRLTGGKTSNEGIVEIQYHGTWGTICNDLWDLNDAHVICRQLGFSKAISLKTGYSMAPSAGTSPIITALQCRGGEVSLGLCVFRSLEYVTHRCSHIKDAQVVCAGQAPTNGKTTAPTRTPTRIPTRTPTRTPTGASTKKYTGASTKAPTKRTTRGPTTVPTTPTETPSNEITVDVMILNVTIKQWNPDLFKESLAKQLNKFCRNHSCGSVSEFTANDIIIQDGYPKKTSVQRQLDLRFKVFNSRSHKPIPSQIIYSMAKNDGNIADYQVLPATPNAQKRSTNKQRTVKIVVIVVVVALVVALGALIVFFIWSRRHKRILRSVVRYRVSSQSGNADNHEKVEGNDNEDDDPLLELDDDASAPFLT